MKTWSSTWGLGKPLDHAPLRNPLVPDVRITAGRSRRFFRAIPIYCYWDQTRNDWLWNLDHCWMFSFSGWSFHLCKNVNWNMLLRYSVYIMYPAKVWITPVFLKKNIKRVKWCFYSSHQKINGFFHVFSATGKQTIASTEGLGWRGEASENGPEILEFPPACVGNLWKTMGSGDSSRDLLITYCSWRLPTTFERVT